MDIDQLSAWPLCRLYRMRKLARRLRNAELAALFDAAISKRCELLGLGEI